MRTGKRAVDFHPGEEKAPGKPYSGLPVPEGDLGESWGGMRDRMRGIFNWKRVDLE